ncbi:transcriptional regulator, TetR family [Acinetobacter baumannii]|uniref:TetR/AcrR family transcriptional regulator n=1 Tax=Acinetobacter baumannii TaxID=470 RepID=UPI000DE76BBF|nr:TetR/AcrR family transcriptional regulator [Acinetobacter baumannii]SSI83706.1 transcriptional regulator TetR family [Acinetobacter baumannii]SSO27909.1 transcriptional regulator, TetR family [Acinetobacter baumannii]SSP05329.1 transcriptional regulator, TetR family [Acinetobacter baumannii]
METKSRGRPRSYDPERVLERALHAFWKGGFSGTSLDTLALVTGLNRPSLYAGLGDKRTIYIKAMRYFQKYAKTEFGKALEHKVTDRSFADVILRYLQTALKVDGYHEDIGLSGCAVISTAMADALADNEIQAVLKEVLTEMDEQLYQRLKLAQQNLELPHSTDIDALAFLMTSAVHSIGIRARAGLNLQQIEGLLLSVSKMLCPA